MSPAKSTLKAWIEIQELPKHIAVVFRIALGGVLAWYVTGAFSWPVFLITLLSVFFIANGAFISNEYFDYQTDRINLGRLGGRRQGLTSTGGTRVLVEGLIPLRQALIASLLFFMLAIPLGLLLQFHFKTGPFTIPLGAAGMFIGWFYTAPPIRAAYRGLGEIFMMLGYGLLIITIYYTQAGWSWLPVAVASTQFAAVPAIKLLRAFPDAEAVHHPDGPRHPSFYPHLPHHALPLGARKPAAGAIPGPEPGAHDQRPLAHTGRAGVRLPQGIHGIDALSPNPDHHLFDGRINKWRIIRWRKK